MIESVFQGRIPIRRIYLNGHVVWKPPVYLPPYLVYLDTKTLGDQTLSKIRLEQGYADRVEDPISNGFHGASTIRIESGNKFVDNAGRMYTAGTPIGLDLFLVNRDITEEYAPKAIQNIMNALHLEQIKGEYLDGPELFVEKYGMSLGTMIGSRIVDEEMYFSGNEVGLSARGAVFTHDLLIKALLDGLATGLSSTGRIADYSILENFPVDHNVTGVGANGELGGYSVLEKFITDYNVTGVGDNGEIVDHSRLFNFLIDHDVTGVGANGELVNDVRLIKSLIDHNVTALGADAKFGEYGRLLRFFIENHATGIGANVELGDYGRFIEFFIEQHVTSLGGNGKLGDYSDLLHFLVNPSVVALVGKAEIGAASATNTLHALGDRSAESLDSKQLVVDRDDVIPGTADRNLSNMNTPVLDHEVEYTAKLDVDAGMSSVSSESIIFTKEPDTYVSESFATKGDLTELSQDTAAKLATNTSATIHAMFWLFPVQTGSDLYIPQVYDNGVITGAVQNGSELLM